MGRVLLIEGQGLRSSQFLLTLPQADLPVDVDAADKDEDGK